MEKGGFIPQINTNELYPMAFGKKGNPIFFYFMELFNIYVYIGTFLWFQQIWHLLNSHLDS